MNNWFVACRNPNLAFQLKSFPVVVGRGNGNSKPGFLVIDNPYVAVEQFVLETRSKGSLFAKSQTLVLRNLSATNPTEVDGVAIAATVALSPESPHTVGVGGVALCCIATDFSAACAALDNTVTSLYCARVNGETLGPWTEDQFAEACGNGVVKRSTTIWIASDPEKKYRAEDLVDFGPDPQEEAVAAQAQPRQGTYGTAGEPVLGESFRCPYCRTVTDISDVLSVSVSPGLLGDPVLGDGEQMRFLPTQFTSNGLAIDSDGGVCVESACPLCHMTIPNDLLEKPQTVMSVIGAAGAGKSVFLASSIWQCRQLLNRLFGITFMDLDPVANRWINAYEEKLFFQEDDTALQQIEKTDLQASNITRSVTIGGESILLPLPSFFSISAPGGDTHCLVVYDSAGEHFRAGADTHTSAVTLNMLGADVLFFMYDPSADPRFRQMLKKGDGTALNYAQRQDVLLAEMAARIRRHLGNNGERRISRPLIFGVSKADLLQDHLPLDMRVYRELPNGTHALDATALRELSRCTESALAKVVPEVVATARSIAENVWFLPVSALGHNPMREGVRPCDIKPIWTELPVVFTLARQGLIKVADGEI